MSDQAMSIFSLAFSAIAILTSTISILLLRRENVVTSTNYCNEKYCSILQTIFDSQLTKNEKQFRLGTNDLIRLYCYQLLLWQNRLLPTKIFYIWSDHNCYQIQNLMLTLDDHVLTYKDIWKEERACNSFQARRFAQYMDKLCAGKITKLDLLFLR